MYSMYDSSPQDHIGEEGEEEQGEQEQEEEEEETPSQSM